MKQLKMKQIKAYNVPRNSITLWWLGQAGFIIKSPDGVVLTLDPYLSNSCKVIGDEAGFDMDRQLPPPLDAAELVGVDGYLMTHTHQDHCDPETIEAYRRAGGQGPYVAPAETVEKLKGLGVPERELRMIWPNHEIKFGDVTIRATFAIPLGGDDLTHVGYLISIEQGPKIYFTGDTGWHDLLADATAPHKPDVLVTVINPTFFSLGPADAARLAKRLNVKMAIPCHYQLFAANALMPEVFRTNLTMYGMGDRYQLLQYGAAFDLNVTEM